MGRQLLQLLLLPLLVVRVGCSIALHMLTWANWEEEGTTDTTTMAQHIPLCNAGLVTGITGVLLLLSLFMKELQQQGTLGSSAAALVVAFLLGQFVPALDNG